jgi:hypothetical protein
MGGGGGKRGSDEGAGLCRRVCLGLPPVNDSSVGCSVALGSGSSQEQDHRAMVDLKPCLCPQLHHRLRASHEGKRGTAVVVTGTQIDLLWQNTAVRPHWPAHCHADWRPQACGSHLVAGQIQGISDTGQKHMAGMMAPSGVESLSLRNVYKASTSVMCYGSGSHGT